VADAVGVDFSGYLASHQPYLTTPQVHDLLRRGFSIGGHSLDHPSYSLVSLDEQVRQTVESVRLVRSRFRLDYGAFAFPHGDDRVASAFFTRVRRDGCVDVSFGTAGIVKDRRHRHFQRFSTENSRRPASAVLGHYFARSVFKRPVGNERRGRERPRT
jgi:peptidoglycan/xylan/chitin deacetylase (PgdA/CDA1 family)